MKNTPRIGSEVHRIWKIKEPPRIIVFGWLVCKNRILTINNLARRGWQIVNRCILCKRNAKSVHHLFCECPFSRALYNASIQDWGTIQGTTPLKFEDPSKWYDQRRYKVDAAHYTVYTVAGTLFSNFQRHLQRSRSPVGRNSSTEAIHAERLEVMQHNFYSLPVFCISLCLQFTVYFSFFSSLFLLYFLSSTILSKLYFLFLRYKTLVTNTINQIWT